MLISVTRKLLAGVVLLASLTSQADDTDYRIGAGDLLHVTVFGSPELSNDARVSESGNISYALVGQVPVASKSPAQVEAMLSARFTQGGYLRDPQVSVMVTEYRSQKVSVMGHVLKPGQYPLQSAAHVLDVLAEAGGLVNAEAGDFATLLHKDGTKVGIDLEALFSGDPAQNCEVHGGDTVYVPRAPQFYIYGEVQKPGMYRLERQMTISRAISAGGGLTARGSERRTVVKRRGTDGKEQTLSVDGAYALQADDIVYVKESVF
jgi:polysaccharide export outer membrane protein